MIIRINGQNVKAEILPNNTPTKDETLETFSFALVSSDNPLPIAPMQSVEVIFAVGDVGYFYTVSDSVETYSLKPLRYKHNITCIQNTRELSKHIVRNTVITQPAYLTKSSFNALSMYSGEYFHDATTIQWGNPYYPSLNWASEKLTLDVLNNQPPRNEKIKGIPKLKISFQYVANPSGGTSFNLITNAHTASDILQNATAVQSLTIANSFQLKYTNSSGTAQTPITITSQDLWGQNYLDLNKTYDFPIVKQLADQGYNNFEIAFISSDFVTGEYKSSGVDQPPLPSQVQLYMVQIEIIAETYYYNCYEVLELLQWRQQKRTSTKSLPALFSLPTRQSNQTLYDLFTSTPAPNFIFTQMTMYECVAEVFRVFDAIFTMDDDGVLGIEFFNDLSEGYIDESNQKFTGRNLSIGEDKYINGLVSHYQDARVVETFPNNSEFANLRSVEFGVPDKEDHNFIVPHNIQSVVKVEVLAGGFENQDWFAGGNNTGGWASGNIAIDITKWCVTEAVWSTLDRGSMSSDDWKYKRVKQANSIYYQEGDNKLKVAFTFKTSWNITAYCLFNAAQTALLRMSGSTQQSDFEPDHTLQQSWGDIKMRVTYIASVDGVEKIHSLTDKYEGETFVDQSNGAVDLNKLGLNILGLSLKLGNPTLNATHKITTWANRIKVGQLYEYEGSLWVANVVNYTFFNNKLQGKISFVKNFNQLALRTQLLREKRMSNISKQLTQKSEEVITDYIYFTSNVPHMDGEDIHFDFDWLYSFLYNTFAPNNVFAADPPSKIGDAILYKWLDQTSTKTNGVYIPMVKYGAGNTINFEMGFDHPMSAGNQTKANVSWDGNTLEYFTNYVIYTNDKGFLNETNIAAPVNPDIFNSDFPKISCIRGDYFFSLISYKVHKQPNEILALNYQLAFIPVPGRENLNFVGSEFINNNAFVKDFTNLQRTLRVWLYKDGKKMSNLDVKAPSDYWFEREVLIVEVSEYQSNVVRFLFKITPLDAALAEDVTSWALIDEENNVLLASNAKHVAGLEDGYVRMYFIPKKTRIS